MILGKSIDLTHIKKISLRIWSLTDEIESSIQNGIQVEDNHDREYLLQCLKAFYEGKEFPKETPKTTAPELPTTSVNDPSNQTNLKLAEELDKINLSQAPLTDAIEPDIFALASEAVASEVAEREKSMPPTDSSSQQPTAPIPDGTKVEEQKVEAASVAESAPQNTTTTSPDATTSTSPNETNSSDSPLAADTTTSENATNATNASMASKETAADTQQTATAPATLSLVPPVVEIKEKTDIEKRKFTQRIVPDENKCAYGHAILYDISFESLLFFSSQPFKPGQQIVIEFIVPKSFTVIAEVTYVRHVGVASRIIAPKPTHYRLKAKFLHHHLGDKTLLRNFLTSIDQRHYR